MSDTPQPAPPRHRVAVLLFSIFGVAACGLAYELLIGAIASYLLGSSVLWYSVTIGLFLSGMGLGAFASRWVERRLLERFVAVEIAIGVLGGVAGLLLFAAFTWTALYHVVMVALILAIASLTGLEIPLLTRYVQRFGSLRAALANVLSFDYLGALLASFLFPLVLLPLLGLVKTALAVGLLNLFVAGLTLVTFRDRIDGVRRLAAATALGAALLVAGLVASAWFVSVFESSLYRDEVVWAEQTPYQRVVLTRYVDDTRLYLDGSLQLSSRDEYRYHEALVHPPLALAQARERVLVLGGGDGMAVREVLRWPDVGAVTLVDIDPAMTRLAREHPLLRALNRGALDDPRVTIVHADAFAHLQESGDLWDVVICDFPDPRNEALAKLYSVTFYGLLGRHLAPGGVAATQATSPFFAREAFWTIVATAEAAGLHAVPLHAYVPSFGEWGFVLVAPRRLAPADVAAARLPFAPRFLDEATRARMTRFPPDMARVEVTPSRLDTPEVLEAYARGQAAWY